MKVVKIKVQFQRYGSLDFYSVWFVSFSRSRLCRSRTHLPVCKRRREKLATFRRDFWEIFRIDESARKKRVCVIIQITLQVLELENCGILPLVTIVKYLLFSKRGQMFRRHFGYFVGRWQLSGQHRYDLVSMATIRVMETEWSVLGYCCVLSKADLFSTIFFSSSVVFVLPPALHNILHTPVARYSLFVLKLPLINANI